MGKITSEYNKEFDVMVYTLEGAITYAEMLEAINGYYKGTLTKYTVWDFTNANMLKYFTTDEIKMLAQLVRSLGEARKGGLDALVVPGLLKFGLARMYGVYSDMTKANETSLKSLIFHTKNEAITWIRQTSMFAQTGDNVGNIKKDDTDVSL